MNKRKGFTLVELLVVITIIAILAAIGIGNYSRTMKRGRDARRRSDLKQVQNALEQYYATEYGFYPLIAEVDSFFPEGAIPGDPKNGAYIVNGTPSTGTPGEGYAICTPGTATGGDGLETGGGNASAEDGTPVTDGDYFCVWSLQDDF